MEPAPTSGPSILISGLRALGKASPSEVADWYRSTFGADLPVTEATLRQGATRLAKQDRIHSVPNEHGVYAIGPAPEASPIAVPPGTVIGGGKPASSPITVPDLSEERKRELDREARMRGAPAYTPHVTVTALYDTAGRHFADRVVAVVQRFTPYRTTVHADGSETVSELSPEEA